MGVTRPRRADPSFDLDVKNGPFSGGPLFVGRETPQLGGGSIVFGLVPGSVLKSEGIVFTMPLT